MDEILKNKGNPHIRIGCVLVISKNVVVGGKNGFFKSALCVPIFIYSPNCLLFYTGNQREKYGVARFFHCVLRMGWT